MIIIYLLIFIIIILIGFSISEKNKRIRSEFDKRHNTQNDNSDYINNSYLYGSDSDSSYDDCHSDSFDCGCDGGDCGGDCGCD